MSKRSAEEAGLHVPPNVVDNHHEHDPPSPDPASEEEEVEDEEVDDNEDINDDDDSDSSESPLDAASIRGFALAWLEDKRIDGVVPQEIFEALGVKVALDNLEVTDQWELLEKVVTSEGIANSIFKTLFAPHRTKLPNINTFEDALDQIMHANNIVILTGAGVSVSCGIPDFRSPGGLYSVIEEKYNLPEPQCLFDIHYLRDDPNPFFEFAREIFPGQHKPSPTHYFIKELAQRGKLLRNYTQNIDTLERVAGIEASKLVNCHGSFATASCVVCKRQVDGDQIREDIMSGKIPQCTCNKDGAFMKPDIVFFGEALPDRFDECLKEDCDKVDLLLVMGSSLKVKPVAYVPEVIRANVPQILINRELVAEPHEFDYAYLGDCDRFVLDVCRRFGWKLNGLPLDSYPYPALPPSSSSSTVTASSSSVSISSSSSSSSASISISTSSVSTSVTESITISGSTSPLSPTLAPLSSPFPLSVSSSLDVSALDTLPAPETVNL